ncbi:Cys-rich peptide radical SAM maturase CcpM [Abyssisolibacter fermentans]|uniref:Cys-rich peptide radical SAM maturase CcpM n=1 Tax=Abyssisolibacter fermentans TaxID=1766203 RepID=UPI0008363951|nr:Cys-rich peptide radical SAM maturase CcpM [Abyssisolibacter fermentans]
MLPKKPFIHTFITRDKKYVYDVNTNTILNISDDVFDYLSTGINEEKEISNDLRVKIEKMVDQGFLSERRIKEIEHPYNEMLPFYLKNRLNTVTLQVTQRCNLRCSYCAYSGKYEERVHSDLDMSFETAKKSLDFVIDNSSEAQVISIGFYGGEPLLMFDLIKKCVEYAKENADGREIYYHMTTNGTLLRGEILEYLVENDFKLLISIDGPQEIHDKNRVFAANGKGTFRVIMDNIRDMHKKYPEYVKNKISFNAVLDGTTDFSCTKQFFADYDEIKDLNVNTSFISDKYAKVNFDVYEKYKIQYSYEKFKVLLNKIGRLDSNLTSDLFDSQFIRLKQNLYEREFSSSINDKEHPGGPCVPGVKKLFVNVDGDFFPCERVSEISKPMIIGNIDDGFYLDKIRAILNIGKLSEDLCKNCWAFRFCTMCASAADAIGELSRETKIKGCPSVKFNAEKDLEELCILKEFGCTFDTDLGFVDL